MPYSAMTIRPGLRVTAGFLAICLLGLGCHGEQKKLTVSNPYEAGIVLAVAPVLNFSGETSLDTVAAADLLASELLNVEGVVVLPVNRVMAVLAHQGKTQIESPEHAIQVTEIVGADAILVAGITEYDPYTPIVGIALQMYAKPSTEGRTINPVTVSRQAEAGPLDDPEADATRPVGQVQTVYNAMHAPVREAVRRYAEPRSETENPLGWRQYLKVQSLFLRFCWQDAIQRMLDQERVNRVRLANGSDEEAPI